MTIIGAHHTSYSVSSLEGSLEFYSGLLGCEVLWQREVRSSYFREIVGYPNCVVRAALLRIPGSEHALELFEYVEPRGARRDTEPHNLGTSHISFLVEDLRTAYEELRKKGVRFRSAPVEIAEGANKGGWGVYLEDPDGITVELFQRPKG